METRPRSSGFLPSSFADYGISYFDDDEITARKKFLFRLLHSLHSAGNYCFRSEKHISTVGLAFNLYVTCGIFPRSATISFQGHNALSPSHAESYQFNINRGWHIWKLNELDELCFDITNKNLNFDDAVARLDVIEKGLAYVSLIIYAGNLKYLYYIF